MPYRDKPFSSGQYYHIYNRGLNRSPVFFNDGNYTLLLARLKKLLDAHNHQMIAYCLMSNHFHFLLYQGGETQISKTMQPLFNGYVKTINTQQRRSGPLFEGRFKSKHIHDDAYLLHLCRYIHRNPIDCSPPLVQFLIDWPYSNYLEWLGLRHGSLCDIRFRDDCLRDIGSYKDFVMELPSLKARMRLEAFMFD